ncbi:hypothetical protein T492DRAFT_876902 [Pavlovales sp. CCMP2436]|nr:hypothetical protein T492DRAFT_876902 [Pavlovales sp. CCMP2436]
MKWHTLCIEWADGKPPPGDELLGVAKPTPMTGLEPGDEVCLQLTSHSPSAPRVFPQLKRAYFSPRPQETPEVQEREESDGNFIMVETVKETFSRWSGEEGSSRGQFAIACGAGKTLVQIMIAKTAFELEYVDTVAIFAPNLNLIGQHIEEWEECMGADSFEKLAVGSKIGDKFGISVTTDMDEIFKFLVKRPAPSAPRRLRVIFCTHQSVRRLGEAQKKARTNDEKKSVMIGLAHLDEAQRTTGPIGGPMSMSSVLFDDNVNIKMRLFWTATPRYLKPRSRRDGKLVASMDEPELYGDLKE